MEVVTLSADVGGNILPKCQVTDYTYRGDVLETCVDDSTEANTAAPLDPATFPTRHAGGRPRHERVEYQQSHPRFKDKQRIKRRENHHNLPNFIGRYFPSRDDIEQHAFYCASMLLLLKPWRVLATDLKSPQSIRCIVSGIEYFHHCERSAQEQHSAGSSSVPPRSANECSEDVEMGEEMEGAPATSFSSVTEQDLSELLACRTPRAEDIHGRLAVEAARLAGIFPETCPRYEAYAGWRTLISSSSCDGRNRCPGTWSSKIGRLVSYRRRRTEWGRRQMCTLSTRTSSVCTTRHSCL